MEILLDIYYCSCLKTVKVKLFLPFFSPGSFLCRARLARSWVPNGFDTNTRGRLSFCLCVGDGCKLVQVCLKFYLGDSHTK